MTVSRRRWIQGALAISGLVSASRASAMGRTPLGGKLTFRLPWALRALDPHELGDAAAALFAHAVVDSLFALDATAAPYPTLAASMPVRESGVTVVRLREGLRTARGTALDARDVAFSIERARKRGAAALLSELAPARIHRGDSLAFDFPGAPDPIRVARILASPLVALLPRGFSPSRPDGTGAFRAEFGERGLSLTRNPFAARGAAFLDAIDVASAPDLKASLRAFEAESDDLGWLGTGLFAERSGAVRFDGGSAAWIVLTVALGAGSYAMPGVLQGLVDGFDRSKLAHLGLGALPDSSSDTGWGGPPTEIDVDEDAPHLVEIARAVAPLLSRPGHEVSAAPSKRSRSEDGRPARTSALLAIDVVRPIGPGPLLAMVALANREDPDRARDLMRHPPKLAANAPLRELTRSLRVAVLGELRVAAGVVPTIQIARGESGWDLGATHRTSNR